MVGRRGTCDVRERETGRDRESETGSSEEEHRAEDLKGYKSTLAILK